MRMLYEIEHNGETHDVLAASEVFAVEQFADTYCADNDCDEGPTGTIRVREDGADEWRTFTVKREPVMQFVAHEEDSPTD